MKTRNDAEAKMKLYPHTIPMLKQLKEQGYKIGIISNSSRFTIERMEKITDLLDYIDHPLFSYEAKVIKPDLKMFKQMLEISRCKPEEVLMIGDKLKDDVIPPKTIGMNAIQFHHKDEDRYEKLKKDLSYFGILLT